MTTQLSDSERAARAEANAKASAEAQRLAGEARERDTLAGRKPVVTEVGETLAERLKRERPEMYETLQSPVPEDEQTQ